MPAETPAATLPPFDEADSLRGAFTAPPEDAARFLAAIRAYLDAATKPGPVNASAEWDALAGEDMERLRTWGDRLAQAGLDAGEEHADDVEAAARAYLKAERARTRNTDPAAEERLDAEMLEACLVLRDALDIGDDCEACGAGDNEPCAEGCPCRAGGDAQCDACAGGTGNYEEVARG